MENVIVKIIRGIFTVILREISLLMRLNLSQPESWVNKIELIYSIFYSPILSYSYSYSLTLTYSLRETDTEKQGYGDEERVTGVIY